MDGGGGSSTGSGSGGGTDQGTVHSIIDSLPDGAFGDGVSLSLQCF